MPGSTSARDDEDSPKVVITGWQVPDRENERLLALHRVSTLVAQQRRTDDVLREALQCAVSLVGGDAGSIHRWDAERQRLYCVAANGWHEPIIRPELEPGVGLTGQAFVEQRSIIVNDYGTSPTGTPHSRAAGLKAALAVPMLHAGRCVGILSVGSYDERSVFDEDDGRLIELFAAMVAVALENAELYAELESRLERIRTLSRLTRFASTCLDVDDVLPRIARAAVELTGAAFATFWLADDRSRVVRLGATSDETIAAGLHRREMPYTQGSAGQVAAQRQPITIDDVYQDGRSLNLDWWERNGFKTSLTVPVMHGSSLLAVLSLNGREPFRLNVPQMEVLESFLAQAAAAIWNASLYTSVRRSQEQLQQIVDHSPTAISLKDRDGRYVLVNHRWQEMFWIPKHLPGEAPLGLTDHDLLPAGRADLTRQRDQQVLTTGQPLEYESTSEEHGDRRTYLSVKFPLVDGAAQPYAVCTISTDITERKRWEEEIGGALQAQRIANEQLEHLNKAKSTFVSIVSHEFRSPLTGIQGFSELMRDGEMSAEEMREYSADINREAERLSRMIGELLDLDRMESGRMGLRLSAVDLGAIILQVVASAEPRAPRHRLSVEMPTSLPVIAGDRDKLTQVVVNLLDNAIKYSPDGGSVVVGARVEGSMLRLSVRDQGLGIPPDALESVFERYTRVESEQHQSIAGTGLGLPIVREIVELHSGRAWAESVVGLGSTFHLALPLTDPATIPPDERSESD